MKNTLYGVPLGLAAAAGRADEELDAPLPAVEAGVEPPLLALVLLLLHAAAVTAMTAAPAISVRRFIEPTYLLSGRSFGLGPSGSCRGATIDAPDATHEPTDSRRITYSI
jgi:hypothetical protein